MEHYMYLSKTHAYYLGIVGNDREKSCIMFAGLHKEFLLSKFYIGDPDFFESLRPKFDYFFVKYIPPELLTLTIGKMPLPLTMEGSSSSTQLYCFCQQEEFGDVIQCDSPECPYDRFHFPCIGMDRLQKGTGTAQTARSNAVFEVVFMYTCLHT